MTKFLIATTVAAAFTAVPASAQFYAGADPGGVGVQVGPFGVGVGPRYGGWHDGYHRDRYYTDGYRTYVAADCRIIRERIKTPSGRVNFKTRRICD